VSINPVGAYGSLQYAVPASGSEPAARASGPVTQAESVRKAELQPKECKT